MSANRRNRVPHVGSVGAGNEWTSDNVDSLHPLAGAKTDRSLNGDCRSGGYELSGETWGIPQVYRVEAIERGNGIGTRRNCACHAWVSVGITQFFHWVHQRPSEQPIRGGVTGEHLVVSL